ncbi:MAG: rod shape-determining protein MreC [Candidatus Amoebophilus sp. 36-38]|nr:MAG: rod shape-determining protein MreC [Candidatus Amoebophilus sp. 36-38]
MERLVRFLYAYRSLLTFLLLEFVSLTLIFDHRFYEKVQKINSSNLVIGTIYEFFSNVRRYPELNKIYKQVLLENAALKEQILETITKPVDGVSEPIPKQFKIIPAQVINNSIVYTKNYITINKGADGGIEPGMGVITGEGIVGKVKSVSKHFSTIISLLHTDVLISAKLTSSGVMGTIRWPGYNPLQVQLLYIPRHLRIEVGDKVVTSGYNATFYEGIPIGKVSRVELSKESLFYDILVDLNIEFSGLQYVYVIANSLKQEKDSLEQVTRAYYE